MTIAGSDSSGGAGIAADLKTFAALGVWGTAAITAVTAQNTLGVQRAMPLPAEMVDAQIRAVAADLPVDGIKTGMLATAEIVRAVASAIRELALAPLVVDPVLVSGHGDALLAADALELVRQDLLPLATVVTPNVPEAAALVHMEIADRHDMEAAAEILSGFGPQVVVITGGHLHDNEQSPDLVFTGSKAQWLSGPRLAAPHTHGSGCVLSAAICAELAKQVDTVQACTNAKAFVTRAIEAGTTLGLGRGIGPVDPR